MQARAARIRTIRRRVAIGAATLTAVFSGVILARSQLSEPVSPGNNQIAMVSPASGNGEPEERGTAEMIIAATIGAANALVSDEDHDEEEEGGVAETVFKAASGAAGAVLGSDSSTTTTPEPAPLTTSQS